MAELDHEDAPITFAEIVESLKARPVTIRFRGERRRRRLVVDFEPPDFEPPPLLEAVKDWAI